MGSSEHRFGRVPSWTDRSVWCVPRPGDIIYLALPNYLLRRYSDETAIEANRKAPEPADT